MTVACLEVGTMSIVPTEAPRSLLSQNTMVIVLLIAICGITLKDVLEEQGVGKNSAGL
jgi:hypothetical protein